MRELKLRPFKGRFSTNWLIDDSAHRCVGGVEQRRAPLHRDRFCVAADGQSEIQPCPLVHFDHDAILVDGFEAGCFYGDVVRAGQQRRDAVLALLVRERRCGLRRCPRSARPPVRSATARPEGSVIRPESSAFCASKGTAASRAVTSNVCMNQLLFPVAYCSRDCPIRLKDVARGNKALICQAYVGPPTLSAERHGAVWHIRVFYENLLPRNARCEIIVRMADTCQPADERASGVLRMCFRLKPVSRHQSIRAHRLDHPRRLFQRRHQLNCSDARRLSLARHGIRLASLRWRSERPLAAAGG